MTFSIKNVHATDISIFNNTYTLPDSDSSSPSGIVNNVTLTTNSTNTNGLGLIVASAVLGNAFGNALSIIYENDTGTCSIIYFLTDGMGTTSNNATTVSNFNHVVSIKMSDTTITEILDGSIFWSGTFDLNYATYPLNDYAFDATAASLGDLTVDISISSYTYPSSSNGSVWWFYPCETFSGTVINNQPLGVGMTTWGLTTTKIGGQYSFGVYSSSSSIITTNGIEITPPNTGLSLTNFTYVFGFYVKVINIEGIKTVNDNINRISMLLSGPEIYRYSGVGMFQNSTGFSFCTYYNASEGYQWSSSLNRIHVSGESAIVRNFGDWYKVELVVKPSSKELYVNGTLDFTDSYGDFSFQPSRVTINFVTENGTENALFDNLWISGDLNADLSSYNGQSSNTVYSHTFTPIPNSESKSYPYNWYETLAQNTQYTYSGILTIDNIQNGTGVFSVYASVKSSDIAIFDTYTYSPIIINSVISNGVISFIISPRPISSSVYYEKLLLVANITSPINFTLAETYKITWGPQQTTSPVIDTSTGFGSTALTSWFVLFLVLFVPPAILGVMLGQSGLFIGMILTMGVGAYTGLIPFWLIFLLGMALVILLYERFKGALPDFGGVIIKRGESEE